MGHWSDPSALSTHRRINGTLAICAPIVVAPIVLLAVMPKTSLWPPLSLFAVGVLGLIVLGVVARWSWPGEYFADAAAARVVGTEAVVEMLEAFEPHWFSPTHPRPGDRIERLRAAADQADSEQG